MSCCYSCGDHSVDAIGEVLDAFTLDAPFHFGAEGVTQDDGRVGYELNGFE